VPVDLRYGHDPEERIQNPDRICGKEVPQAGRLPLDDNPRPKQDRVMTTPSAAVN
jgi:hypothetical protein